MGLEATIFNDEAPKDPRGFFQLQPAFIPNPIMSAVFLTINHCEESTKKSWS